MTIGWQDSAMAMRTCLKVGEERVRASAIDWPGWCRSGKTAAHVLARAWEIEDRAAPDARGTGPTRS